MPAFTRFVTYGDGLYFVTGSWIPADSGIQITYYNAYTLGTHAQQIVNGDWIVNTPMMFTFDSVAASPGLLRKLEADLLADVTRERILDASH